MKKQKLKKIETKVNLGVPLTKEEKAYYISFAKKLNIKVLEVLNIERN